MRSSSGNMCRTTWSDGRVSGGSPRVDALAGVTYTKGTTLREWRSGSAIASQAMGRGFESRLPLQTAPGQAWSRFSEILQSNCYGTTRKSAKMGEIGEKSIRNSQDMDWVPARTF